MHKGYRSLLILLGGAVVIFLAVTAFFAELRQTVPVVVAKQTLSAGTRLIPDVLELREVHAADALPGALPSIEDVAGQVLTIARAPGDQLTGAMVGDEAASGIAAALEPGTRAVAVHVNQASGLAGVLRVGDRVTVVAVVDPQVLSGLSSLSAYRSVGEYTSADGERENEPAPTPKPETPAARVTLTGLRVLLVPQLFRYEEALPDEDGFFLPARTTGASQQASVILLEAPMAPVALAPGVVASPVELLALLDAKAQIHLALESSAGAETPLTAGVELYDLYRALAAPEGGMP